MSNISLIIEERATNIGNFMVGRLLPFRQKRSVGPFVFIDHTEVNPEFKGKNVGKQMLMAAVNFARENMLKIIPLCPYAKSVFDKTASIRDVL